MTKEGSFSASTNARKRGRDIGATVIRGTSSRWMPTPAVRRINTNALSLIRIAIRDSFPALVNTVVLQFVVNSDFFLWKTHFRPNEKLEMVSLSAKMMVPTALLPLAFSEEASPSSVEVVHSLRYNIYRR